MSVPVIQQAKIQAQVLVPLIKALQAELGSERANALVRRALGDTYRRFGEEFWRAKNETNVGKAVASAFATYARDGALDYQVTEQSADAFALDVTGCRYAEFYKELGEPELGFLLVCTADFATAEGFGADIKLTRTQTIMAVSRWHLVSCLMSHAFAARPSRDRQRQSRRPAGASIRIEEPPMSDASKPLIAVIGLGSMGYGMSSVSRMCKSASMRTNSSTKISRPTIWGLTRRRRMPRRATPRL